jgi:hypothetical protein
VAPAPPPGQRCAVPTDRELGTAAETALAELLVLRQLVTENVHTDLDAEMPEWRSVAQRHMGAAEMALLLMPRAEEARTRIVRSLIFAAQALVFVARTAQGPKGETPPLQLL